MTTLDWIGAWLFACGFSLLVSLAVYCWKLNGIKTRKLFRLYDQGY